jgi:antitoxin PrlF
MCFGDKIPKSKDTVCCSSGDVSCCKVACLISMDKRGQMVLPKEVRDKAGIKGGDKLALVFVENGGKVCCMALMKADVLGKGVKEILGPMAQEIIKED